MCMLNNFLTNSSDFLTLDCAMEWRGSVALLMEEEDPYYEKLALYSDTKKRLDELYSETLQVGNLFEQYNQFTPLTLSTWTKIVYYE